MKFFVSFLIISFLSVIVYAKNNVTICEKMKLDYFCNSSHCGFCAAEMRCVEENPCLPESELIIGHCPSIWIVSPRCVDHKAPSNILKILTLVFVIIICVVLSLIVLLFLGIVNKNHIRRAMGYHGYDSI